MQEKLTINPKYLPISFNDELKRKNNKNTFITIILGLILTILVSILIAIYIFIISPALSYHSCYNFGCFNPHRAELYAKVPEDNITIPKILIKKLDLKRDNFRLVCYYNLPADEHSNELQINDLDPNLCTHLNVGFASIENNTINFTKTNIEMTQRIINDLKGVNKDLKVLLSIGGSGSSGFNEMVKNHTTRKIFIQSTLNYIKSYKLDGIDLDWEFPNEIGINVKERTHFSQLLHEIRKEIDRQKKHKFLLTLAVAAPYFVALNAYDIGFINDQVDFVNVMTYDFHFYTKFTPFTGINSPLYSLPHDVGIFGTLNINYSINFWVSQGMDKDKVVVGLPTYGHTYKLINQRNNGISAPAIGYGETGNNGFLDYSQVCEFMYKNKVIPNFDEVSKSPYATSGYEWISFDDTKSLTYKAEFIKNNNFGGAMIYCLNSDDYKNVCNAPFYGNKTKFPLVQTIRDVLINPEY
nr:chitinase-3-like protein 2 isoform X1 [Onthophagus taurus]XP_022903707.1 chitinase-3-like protein 2 isoform X2 [Onthophagus taurus]